MPAVGDDRLGQFPLGVQGIHGDHLPRDVEPPAEFLRHRYLVGLIRYGLRMEAEAVLGGPDVEHLQLPDLPGVGRGPGAPEHRLAVHRDDVGDRRPVGDERGSLDPAVRLVHDAADDRGHDGEELVPVHDAEAPLEGVVARDPSRKRQPPGQPFPPLEAVRLHLGPLVGPGEYGEERHRQHLGEDVPAVGLVPGVGEGIHRLPYRHDHRDGGFPSVALPFRQRLPHRPEHRVPSRHNRASEVVLDLLCKSNYHDSTRFAGEGKPRRRTPGPK